MKTNLLALKLFNSVLAQDTEAKDTFVSKFGVFIPSQAVYAKYEILNHLRNLKLSGQDLNKTFYKSWAKVQNSDRLELFIDQILHYMSTYGTNFEGEVYIPDQVLDVPDLKITVYTIGAMTADTLIEKSLDVLRSGIALKEETLGCIFDLLESLDYSFTGKEGVRNKEALVMMADLFNIYPESPEEFLRYAVYKATNSTSLVKSDEVKNEINSSRIDVSDLFKQYGRTKLSTIFNRFKPLFLAFKQANPNNRSVINKIAKLSKENHKPMVSNPLNQVTYMVLGDNDLHWLENATNFALFKALSACYARMNGQDSFVYRVRNGRSWTKENTSNIEVCEKNFKTIMKFLKERINGEGKTVFIPSDVVYALPTSEKMFVGNIPTGTKFLGEKLAAGMYWEDSWGARDLDLSGLNIAGKVGWNASFYDYGNRLTYSGDETSAPNGAVEYLYATNGVEDNPTLAMMNVYSGSSDAGYKIIIGKGDNVNYNYMMNPNNVMVDVKTECVQKQMILGMFIPEDNNLTSFVLLNFGAGSANVSGNNHVSKIATKALYQQWKNALTLNTVLEEVGFTIVDENTEKNEGLTIDFNLEVDKLTKSTFVDLFS